MLSPDEAFQKLIELKDVLIEENEKNLNESDTRFKIIDTLFIDILGWNKSELETEHPIGETKGDNEHKKLYADYLLQTNHNKFLIEAKRNGRYFSIPQSFIRTYTTEKGVLTSDKENKKFIEQAVTYMTKIGTPFCVLSNGLQIMIVRSRSLAQKKDVLVFKGIEDIIANFIDFYNILSPSEVGHKYLDLILDRSDEIRHPPTFTQKAFDSLTDKFEQTSSSAIRAVTEDYVSRYFSELTYSRTQIETLKNCYCDPTGKFTSFSKQLRQKVTSKQINDIKPLRVQDRVWKDGNFEDKYIATLKESEGKVFILAGGVGAGKTTFINHFYFYELDEQVRKDLIWINIDFLKFTGRTDQVDAFLTNTIEELLQTDLFTKYRLFDWETKLKIYEKEIDLLRKGLPPFIVSDEKEMDKEIFRKIQSLESNKEVYFKRIFQYLRDSLGQKICFVFDNTDQKPNAQQLEILMNAFNRADSYQAVIITALRLENYFKSLDRPPFDAYQPITFRIEPPTVKELLKKRLIASLEYERGDFLIDLQVGRATPKVIKIPITKFVKLLENTLDYVPEKQIEEMFDHLSGGNMRRVLAIFRKFIQSGNSTLYQNYELIKRLKDARFKYEEVLESIALGDNKYYQSQDSPIKNIFNYSSQDGFYSHFSNIYLLQHLKSKAEHQSQYNNGFVSLEEIYKKFSIIFATKDKMMNTLDYLLNQFMIESNIGEREKLVNTDSIAISELGIYYLEHFLKDWHYLKYIMVDTTIKNRKSHELLTSEVKKMNRTRNKNAKIKNTLKSVEVFLNYLKKSEEDDMLLMDSLLPKGVSNSIKPCMPQIINDFRQAKATQLRDLGKVLQSK